MDSIENELLRCCCISKPYGNVLLEQVQALLRQHPDLDSKKFLSLVDRHRLIPCVYQNLKEFSPLLSAGLLASLKEKYAANTRNMLIFSSEIIRLTRIFKEHQLNLLSFKGPVLSQQIYGDLACRRSHDIDLLVQPEDMVLADILLKKEGYQRICPAVELNRRQVAYSLRHEQEFQYWNAEKKILLELHWKLFYLNQKFIEEGIWENATSIILGNDEVTVLSKETNILYLCLHGAYHRWFRLFWLRDLAEIAFRWTDTDWDKMLTFTLKIGVERSLVQGLVLANKYFRSPLPSSILNYYSSHKNIERLVKQADLALNSSEEKYVTRKLAVRINRTIYLTKLQKSRNYKIRVFNKVRTTPGDWDVIKLPEKLFFLYFILRPFIYFYDAYLRKPNRGA
ncbi:MAG: nucleotidyltransferase family protein [Bacteroidota bacterium]|nr:nucleotidyltransferase family protein [Bacteroidota bacterium]